MLTLLSLIVLSQQNPSIYNNGSQVHPRPDRINLNGAGVSCSRSGSEATCRFDAGCGCIIPADISAAGYWTKGVEATLTNEFPLGSLATGLLVNTTGTGVPTIKAANTCVNQFGRSDNASGVWTCSTVADADISGVSGSKVTGTVPASTTATTATALATDPTDCSAGQYATNIAASGNLTCAQVTTAQLSGTVANGQLASSYSGVGACGANTWASTLNGNGAPTCTQPGFTNISGTLGVTQGGTGITSLTANDLVIGNSTNSNITTRLPNCTAVGSKLTYDNTTRQFVCDTAITASDVVCSGTCVVDAEISGLSGVKVSGPVPSATALAADPTDCGANQYATTIGTNGNLTCTQPAFTGITGTVTIIQGGTGVIARAANDIVMGSGTNTTVTTTMPLCTAVGSKLTYDNTTRTWVCSTSITSNDVACSGACVADAEISAVSGSKVSGAVANATQATQATGLDLDPADCAAGKFALGVDRFGVATCSGIEAQFDQRPWVGLPYTTGATTWADYAAGFEAGASYVDPFGVVHLRGAVKRTAGSGLVIATLGSTARPVNNKMFPVLIDPGALGYVVITSTGTVTLTLLGSGTAAFVSLEGITFDKR